VIGNSRNRYAAAFQLSRYRSVNVEEVCAAARGAKERWILTDRCGITGSNRARGENTILVSSDRLRGAGAVGVDQICRARCAGIKIIVIRDAAIVSKVAGSARAAAISNGETGTRGSR